MKPRVQADTKAASVAAELTTPAAAPAAALPPATRSLLRMNGEDTACAKAARPASMPAVTNLTEGVLEALGVARLRQLVEAAGVEGADRRSKAGLIRALSGVSLLDAASTLTVPDLKTICTSLGLDAKGPKPELVARLAKKLGGGKGSTKPAAAPPASARETGTLKSALRRLVLESAGGYRGKDAHLKFTTALLACFGWPHGRPEGAQVPATLRIAEHGRHTTRQVAALWNERGTLIEVAAQDTPLDSAWKDLLGACLQIDPVPQFVVLTNQRDVRLYDLARDREAPRLSIPIDDLPKYSEAFPFLTESWKPGDTPKIINVGKVSREVADLVARLYRSLKAQHSKRESDVIQFTLQCIITMFAEDIGLLPQQYFTTLLYEGARHRDADKRLRELFRQMGSKDVPRPRAVAYFNGGLFKDPVTLPLGDEQLSAMMKAAEANWKYVDPHIFGSVFQGIMNDEERHATGAHYTAHEDIMRVVGPTIVEPWRKRIRAADTLAELKKLRDELFRFRVLDPACGSGNFLYVSFRELYRLDTELLGRIRELPSSESSVKLWTMGIPATNFYGIDTNKFAVELAKVTLNIARKLAFEERKEAAAAASNQLEVETDPSLPLDNLDENIVCEDALFSDWPKVEAIVGNPPFLGGLKVRREHGESYLRRIQERFPDVNGRADFCAFWFRRAHDRLPPGGRAGRAGPATARWPLQTLYPRGLGQGKQ